MVGTDGMLILRLQCWSPRRWGVSGETHVFQLFRPISSQETNMLKWKPFANASVIAALIAVYSVLAAPHKW